MLSNGELFDLLEKLESRVDRYWSFFSIAVIAVTGWLLTGKDLKLVHAPFVAAGLAVFFGGNFGVIKLTEGRIRAVESEIEARAQQAEVLSPEFRNLLARLSYPRRQLASAVIHVTIDTVVIALVFLKAS